MENKHHILRHKIRKWGRSGLVFRIAQVMKEHMLTVESFSQKGKSKKEAFALVFSSVVLQESLPVFPGPSRSSSTSLKTYVCIHAHRLVYSWGNCLYLKGIRLCIVLPFDF